MSASLAFKKRWFRSSEVRQAVELYGSGKSLTEIAEILGFTRQGVKRHVVKHCALRPKGQDILLRNKLSEEDEREAIRLYKKGASTIDLSRLYGRYPPYFSRLLKENGIEIRGKQVTYTEFSDPKTLALTLLVVKLHREEKLTCKEIAIAVGRSRTAVRSRLVRAGAIRSKSEAFKIRYEREKESDAEREARSRRVLELIANFRREFQTAP